MSDKMILKIVSPDTSAKELECDKVFIPVADSKLNKGGSYGIHPHHATAIFALGQGSIKAESDGESVFEKSITNGLANVKDNQVIILV